MNLQLQLKKTQDANSELVLAVQFKRKCCEFCKRIIHNFESKRIFGKIKDVHLKDVKCKWVRNLNSKGL